MHDIYNMDQLSQDILRAIICRGEDSSVEFKEGFSEDVMKTLAAFANGYNGIPKGLLLIGVDHVGNIIGLKEDPDNLQKRISNLCRDSCQPPLAPKMSICTLNAKNILVIEVARSNMRPHRFKGVCYIRVGSTTRKATAEEEFKLREDAHFRAFDDSTVSDATINDLDFNKVMEYYKATRSEDVTEYEQRKPASLIEALGLARKEEDTLRPTVAAILVFGKNPQRFFPLSSVNAIRFRGTTLADSQLDRKEIKGTVDRIIDECVSFIQKFSTIGSIITNDSIRRVDITEYPNLAIREAIANAVVHRDYGDPGSQIDLYMFDDRIEIRNPGTLGGGLTVEDLVNQTGKRWLRNPDIAGLLLELRYIEKAGTGIPRMYRALRENGSPDPEFIVDSNSVKVVIRAHPDYSARRKFEEGLLAKSRGEIEKARTLFKQALEIRPDYAEALGAWAALEGEIGSLEEARKLYGLSLQKNPRDPLTYLNWAVLEDRHGNHLEARRLYQEGTKIDPNNAVLWHSWATMERRLGNYPKARELYKRATQLAPEQSINWQAWGQLESKCRNYEEAERLFTTALKYATDSYTKAWIYSDLAFALGHLRRPVAEIEKYYRLSLKLNPNSAQTNYLFSEFLRKLGREEEAREYARRAIILGWRPRIKRYQHYRRPSSSDQK
jgi:ATP-dependent DNA helicase RecG